MTLIVAVVAGNWAFHASDRVVSAEPTPDNPTGEFDPHSNKTVVVVGTDCWVVLGYTGIAYLDGKPTDHLIAEAISGCDEFSPAMYTFWQQPPDLHYREIRRRMEDKLRDAYSRLPDSEKGRVTLVLASGVQEKDGIVTKVMFRTKVQGDSVTSIEMRPETPGFKGFYIDAVGMVKNEIIDRAKARLSAIGPPVTAAEVPDIVQDILKDAVLETSQLTPKVGDNVMTVVLDNPGQAIRTALHIADPQRQAELFEQGRQSQPGFDQFAGMSTVSTPYVLIPGGIWGPSIGKPGGWDTGGITFDFTGFDDQPGAGGGAFFGIQPRKDWP